MTASDTPTPVSSELTADLSSELTADLAADVLHAQLRAAGRELGKQIGTFLRVFSDRINQETQPGATESDFSAFLQACEKLLPGALGQLLAEIGAGIPPLIPTDYAIAQRMMTSAWELSVLIMQAQGEFDHRHADWQQGMRTFLASQGVAVPAGEEGESK